MKRTLLPPLLVALLLGTGGTVAWNKREATWQAEREFATRQLTLLEEENSRLRLSIEQSNATSSHSRQLKLRGEIEQKTAELRGLDFRRPVAYQTLSRDALKGKLLALFDKEYTAEQFSHMEQGYVAIGLMPAGTNLKETFLHLLDEQIAAFYDQHAGELFMFDNSSLDKAQDRMILSHELVHALQDQHFKLASMPLDLKNNDDLVLATSSLVEGDAVVLMYEFLQSELSLKGIGQLLATSFTQKYEQLSTAPAFLRESLLFRYQEGAAFCQALLESGSRYDGISRAYSRPPTSTSQILHPEKYLLQEEPLPISLPHLTIDGQKPSFDNVMGEFGVGILLREWGFEKHHAAHIATGWRGDRYFHWQEPDVLLWKSAWESPAKAREVATALRSTLAKRYNATFDPEAGQNPATGTSRGLAVVHPSETEVLLINTADASRLPALLEPAAP